MILGVAPAQNKSAFVDKIIQCLTNGSFVILAGGQGSEKQKIFLKNSILVGGSQMLKILLTEVPFIFDFLT